MKTVLVRAAITGKSHCPPVKSKRYSQRSNCVVDHVQIPDQRIRINVSGNVFETFESTLARFPNTLLGCKTKRNYFFDSKRQEYFFNRNRNVFDSILFYYQSHGILSCPPNIRTEDFIEELIFFEFSEKLLIQFLRDEGVSFNAKETVPEKTRMPQNRVLETIWQCFEQPKSSFAAKVVSWWSVTFILLSIIVVCAESLPHPDEHKQMYFKVYNNLETVCVAWFTMELLLRFISAPDKIMFLIDLLNWVDLLATLPFYFALMIKGSSSKLQVFRLLRVCRLFKLFRHSSGLRVLSKTIRATWPELLMIVFFGGISTIILSGGLFYAEFQDQKDSFSSIPAASWFVIISLTNVGYGDMVPVTLMGRLIGSMCALVGVLVLALPSPVIARKFKLFYEEAKKKTNQDRMNRKNALSLPSKPAQTSSDGIGFTRSYHSKDVETVV